MKDERFQILIAILLVPVLLAGIVAFCKFEVETAQSNNNWLHHDEYETNMDIETKPLAEQGYTMYQQLPDRMKKLQEENLFDDGVSVMEADRTEDMEEEEETSSWWLGNIEYLKEKCIQIVGMGDDPLYMHAELQFDPEKYCFVQEELARIEACGFPGFSERMQEIAGMEKINEEQDEMSWMAYDNTYYLYYGGVEFRVRRSGKSTVGLGVYIGMSTCYAPEKYQEFIQKVTEGGDYFLYATCVGGETDVITFCKNDSLAYNSYEDVAVHEDCRKKLNNKKITCLFRDGKLADYYVTTTGNVLELDEADQAFLDTYTKGLGKELSGKPSMISEWAGVQRIYRTK